MFTILMGLFVLYIIGKAWSTHTHTHT